MKYIAIKTTYYLFVSIAFVGILIFGTGLIWSTWRTNLTIHHYIVTFIGLAISLISLCLIRITERFMNEDK